MELKVIYEHEEMRDMVVHVNSDGLQKIMTILTDERNIIVTQLTQRAQDGACTSCKLELTPQCPIRTGNGCDLFQPRQ